MKLGFCNQYIKHFLLWLYCVGIGGWHQNTSMHAPNLFDVWCLEYFARMTISIPEHEI